METRKLLWVTVYYLVPASTKAVIYLLISGGPVYSEFQYGASDVPNNPYLGEIIGQCPIYTWGVGDTYPEKDYAQGLCRSRQGTRDGRGDLNYCSGFKTFTCHPI